MIAKLLLQNSLYVVAMGVLLFASAGTLALAGGLGVPGDISDHRARCRPVACAG